MNKVDKAFIINKFKDKRVVILGSAPSCLDNDKEHINGFDYIIRVNNYKIDKATGSTGTRTDVHYSFYGSSIKKQKQDLISDGVKLCMCKCPDAFLFNHNVPWDPHNRGSDFRWIYENRKDFWFCDTYIPTKEDFLKYFDMLDKHIPTTGFSCILDLISCKPKELYITGFDGFRCGLHNVNERWRDKSKTRKDPICHEPEKELKIIFQFEDSYPFVKLDNTLKYHKCKGK